ELITKEKIADVILMGKKNDVMKLAGDNGVSLAGVTILDPSTDEKRKEVFNAYYEKRKHKGISPEEAEKLLSENFVYYGAMITAMGLADGYVSGASHTTGDIARASIHCLQIDKEVGTVSSSFIMELENCPFGEKGLFIFGDCAIMPDPSAKQLAGIAIGSSDMFRKLFGVEPRVAMLSYSTKGSAEGDSINKVREALAKVKERKPSLMIDGELQIDAALVPEVAAIKSKGSNVAGRANVLIFPNLDSGNISYKLTQRLGNARAVGPILQGLDKPCSDLSRGCSVEDVMDAVAVVSVLAQK
ncbi:MAG TPA: phosphate acetyltransferase, partial [Candidatus Omnitrophota bacterium]|nr:phosphate acetyltransferase [Candidatus Omnitrophota bacterium]